MRVSEILSVLTQRMDELFAELRSVIAKNDYSAIEGDKKNNMRFYIGSYHFVLEASMNAADVNSMTIFKTYEIITNAGEVQYKLLDMNMVNLISGLLLFSKPKVISVGEDIRQRNLTIHTINNFKVDYWNRLLDYIASKAPQTA